MGEIVSLHLSLHVIMRLIQIHVNDLHTGTLCDVEVHGFLDSQIIFFRAKFTRSFVRHVRTRAIKSLLPDGPEIFNKTNFFI